MTQNKSRFKKYIRYAPVVMVARYSFPYQSYQRYKQVRSRRKANK